MWSAHAITEKGDRRRCPTWQGRNIGRRAMTRPRLYPVASTPQFPHPRGCMTTTSAARRTTPRTGWRPRALSVVPSGRLIARANRYFMMRAVLLMADQGIRQFIDLGTGIPTSPSVHELAQAIHPNARVLYVDNDPVVTAHNRPLLAANRNVKTLQADIRQPDSILGSVETRELIDFGQPVGMLFVAVLHFVRDQEDPEGIVRAFTGHLAPGSDLALSHIADDGTDIAVMAAIRQAYAHASAPAVFRTGEQVHRFFSGFELAPPGLVDVTRWGPHAAMRPARPSTVNFLAGVGYKQSPVRPAPEHGPGVASGRYRAT